MPFLNPSSNGKKMIDKVFKAAIKAKEAKLRVGVDHVVDATLGTLFDENATFVAFDSVWNPYNSLPNIQKSKYAASIQGNPTYRKAVYNWLFGEIDIDCEIIATPGGAGAVSSTLKNMLDPGQIVLKPSLAWGPYTTMANEFNLQTEDYNLFDGDHFDITSFKHSMISIMERQGKVLVILNDPCHNPSGYTMSDDEWIQVMSICEEVSSSGPVILLHDIAYVDFSTNPNWKASLKRYRSLPSNMMVVIAFSLSKTFTAYGMRVGASVAISSDKDQLVAFKDAMIYSARSIWSTVNNSVMELFHHITTTPKLLEAYQLEKRTYINLIHDRANIFVTEANQIGLPLYPHKEGFFATIIVENDKKETLNQSLQDHNIFLVEVNNGLRVALCSVPKSKLIGLASRIYNIMYT